MKTINRRSPIYVLIFLLNIPAAFTSRGQDSGPLAYDTVRFRVNMEYMFLGGQFNPATDTMFVAGTMNNWVNSSPMERIDTSLIFETTYILSHGITHQYAFRMRVQDTVYTEQADPLTRMIRVSDTTMTVTNFYNNYNPASVPVRFNCNMWYQVMAGHFAPVVDYVNVTGNFNGWSGTDILFPDGADSIYSAILFMDTAMIGKDTLSFRFQMNGNPSTTELEGSPARAYLLKADSNTYSCWYNDIDPSVPAIPFVFDVSIQGIPEPKQILTGIYSYEDYNLRPEGESVYQWYLADSAGGTLSAIDTATTISYYIDSTLIGKYLVFEVTPVTSDSVAGLPVQVWSTVITGVGIPFHIPVLARTYPNPVHDILVVEPTRKILKTEIIDRNGRILFQSGRSYDSRISLDVGFLSPGVYLLRFTGENGEVSIVRFIRL